MDLDGNEADFCSSCIAANSSDVTKIADDGSDILCRNQ